MKAVLGIRVCDDAVGCDKLEIKPCVVPGVTFASGWLDTPKGRVKVTWRLVDGEMIVDSSIPPGIKVVGQGSGK